MLTFLISCFIEYLIGEYEIARINVYSEGIKLAKL